MRKTENETAKCHVFVEVSLLLLSPLLYLFYFFPAPQTDPVSPWTKSGDHVRAQSLYDEESKSSDVSQNRLFGLIIYELVQREGVARSERPVHVSKGESSSQLNKPSALAHVSCYLASSVKQMDLATKPHQVHHS